MAAFAVALFLDGPRVVPPAGETLAADAAHFLFLFHKAKCLIINTFRSCCRRVDSERLLLESATTHTNEDVRADNQCDDDKQCNHNDSFYMLDNVVRTLERLHITPNPLCVVVARQAEVPLDEQLLVELLVVSHKT